MKFTVTMKDPDTLHEAIEDAVRFEVEGMPGLDAEEREALQDQRRQKVAKTASAWFRYGEYLSVEIDTDAGTATVLPACG